MNDFIHLEKNKLNRKRNLIILLVPTIFFILILALLFKIEDKNKATAQKFIKDSAVLGESDNPLDTSKSK